MANISSKKQGTRSFEKTPETYNRESKGTLVQSKLYIFEKRFFCVGVLELNFLLVLLKCDQFEKQ